MVRRVIRLARTAIVLVAFWATVVYGLPWFRAAVPGLCARWDLQGGFCGPEVQNALAVMDRWVQRYLRPLPRHPRVQDAFARLQAAVRQVEALARLQVGDERVNAALRGADVALRELEEAVGQPGQARAKIAAIPENAERLLAEVRSAFDRLRAVLSSTSRRAEEVSEAVEETRKALDALSKVFPTGSSGPAATPALSPAP